MNEMCKFAFAHAPAVEADEEEWRIAECIEKFEAHYGPIDEECHTQQSFDDETLEWLDHVDFSGER